MLTTILLIGTTIPFFTTDLTHKCMINLLTFVRAIISCRFKILAYLTTNPAHLVYDLPARVSPGFIILERTAAAAILISLFM
jgi:hypothetical protein